MLANFRRNNDHGPETEWNIKQAIMVSKQSEIDPFSILRRVEFTAHEKLKAHYKYPKLQRFYKKLVERVVICDPLDRDVIVDSDSDMVNLEVFKYTTVADLLK